jgi:hypothetical protein
MYFYWSGLMSHFPIVLQFIGLQLFLMLYMLVDRFRNTRGQTLTIIFLYLLTIIAVIFAFFFVFRFNFDKREFGKIAFRNNFKEHMVFNWNFERAKLITTIDPEPIQEAISLIQKYYFVPDSGIYIISKYDNLIPFLAKRYSLMPHFSMSGYLLNEQVTSKTISLIINNRPEYIFVDSDIELKPFDPWSSMFNDEGARGERESRFGRYLELRKIFDAVKDGYVSLESSEILTVYKRKIK